VRAALVAAFAAGQHLKPSYVAGTVKGSVYYGFDPATAKYWAVARFSPTAAARAADQRLNGGAGDPLIQFQDGPWVFSRGPDSAWKLAGDTGGGLCAPSPPQSLLTLWGNGARGCQ
jgi:hypothetical protein